ncbi:MAG: hypothetical protein M1356_09215 [Gammaproteobacteria bacterium]|nr:hypothetical protein [Gammaproteobacteria bacterium]
MDDTSSGWYIKECVICQCNGEFERYKQNIKGHSKGDYNYNKPIKYAVVIPDGNRKEQFSICVKCLKFFGSIIFDEAYKYPSRIKAQVDAYRKYIKQQGETHA